MKPVKILDWPKLCAAFFSLSAISLAIGWAVPFISPERAYTLLDLDSFVINGLAIGVALVLGAICYCAVRWPRLSFAAFGIAVTIRAATVFVFGDIVPKFGGDPWAYLNIAHNIALNRGIVLTGGVVPVYAVYPPLYPVLLSLLIGPGMPEPAAVFSVNFVCDIWAALILRRIALEFGLRQVAWALAAIYLILPPTITGSLIASKEPLAVALTLTILLAFIRARRALTFKNGALLGVATGMLAMTQPAWLGLVVGFGFLFLYWSGLCPTARLAAFALPVFGVVLAPWALRNYLLFDAFVPLTTAMGANLYFVVTNSYEASSAILSQGHDELEGSRLGWMLATHEIKQAPLQYLWDRVATFGLSWMVKGWHGMLLVSAAGPDGQFWASVIARVTALSDFGMMLAALWATRVRRIDRDMALILLAAVTSMVAFNFWFELGERHLLILSPLYVLFTVHHLGSPSLSNREDSSPSTMVLPEIKSLYA